MLKLDTEMIMPPRFLPGRINKSHQHFNGMDAVIERLASRPYFADMQTCFVVSDFVTKPKLIPFLKKNGKTVYQVRTGCSTIWNDSASQEQYQSRVFKKLPHMDVLLTGCQSYYVSEPFPVTTRFSQSRKVLEQLQDLNVISDRTIKITVVDRLQGVLQIPKSRDTLINADEIIMAPDGFFVNNFTMKQAKKQPSHKPYQW